MSKTVTSQQMARNAIITANIIEVMALNIVNVNRSNLQKPGYTPISIREARAFAFAELAKRINASSNEEVLKSTGG